MGNSVIYRPAYDAEVEYLESTGTQFIDTGFIPDDTCGMYVRAYPLNTSSQKKVVGCGSTVQSPASRWWINFAGSGGIEISWINFNTTIPYNKNQWYEVTNNFLNSRMGTIDGVNQNVPYPTLRDNNYTAYIFNANSNVPDSFVGRISNVKFSRGSEIVMDFIPVRIDSVGYLYDKVSKQLFANKGTGNFILGNDVSNAVIPQQRCVLYFGNQRSVGFERIYEEYEWLVANGDDLQSSGPQKVALFSFPSDMNLVGKTVQLTMGAPCRDIYVYRYVGAGLYLVLYVWNGNVGINSNNQTILSSPLVSQEPMVLDFENNLVSYNGQQIQIAGDSFYIYFPSTAIEGKRKYGRIYCQGLFDFTPCKLLQPIPAILDGNGIARQAGECGMWDKVGNRFYGNVANSGTFKAVNLAEGVDYEVHQWLKVKLVGTNASMMTLPVNSYSFAFSRKPLKGRNVPYFITEGNDVYLYSTTDDTIRIWNQTQYGYYYSGTSFNWGDTISIVSSGNGLEVNSQVIPQNTFPCKYVYFGANDVDGTENYTSSITVDGIERYIPVKLLKSIPSKYDANGIARQAGECGMYDTVNDVFYGNVASSGSFTVSND